MTKTGLSYVIEIARLVGIMVGINLGYWFGSDLIVRFEVMSAIIVLCLCGTVAFESLVLGESASVKIGYQPNRGYQIQSGLNNLALALTMLLAILLRWSASAYLALLSTALIFFFLSALNHTWSWIKGGNKKIVNVLRPVLSTLLIISTLPVIVQLYPLIH